MPAATGKKKKCVLVVNLSGVFFFRPAGRSYKISEYVSMGSVRELVWVDPKRRDIVTATGTSYFSCEHSSEAVVWISECYAALFQGMTTFPPIRFVGFPEQIPLPTRTDFFTQGASLQTLRYMCLSLHYGYSSGECFLDLFKDLAARRHDALVLTDAMNVPFEIRAVITPLAQVGGFSEVHFVGFAPFSVCRLAHHLLKKVPTIQSIVFDGYSFLIPAQLRMKGIPARDRRPLTFVLRRMSLPDKLFASFVEALGEYDGDIQRFSLNGMILSPSLSRPFQKVMKRSKGFRALEMFELEDTNVKAIPADKLLQKVLTHCRYLQSLNLTRWSPTSPFQFRHVSKGYMLKELVLKAHDLSQPFANVILPPKLRLLDVSQSTFSPASIGSLLSLVATGAAPLALVMADLQMNEQQWTIFFDIFTGFPKPTILAELDWSGNPIPGPLVTAFVNFFIQGSAIRFIGLDRVFGNSDLQNLQSFLYLIPPGCLWGISIRGGRGVSFSGNIKSVLRCFDKFNDLSIIHLDGQGLTDFDFDQFMTFVQGRRKICDVSFDDAEFSSETKFYNAYRCIDSLGIKFVGRPFGDLRRLLPPGAPRPKAFENLQTALRKRFPSSTHRLRANWYARRNDTFSVATYAQFAASFPGYFLEEDRHDPFSLGYEGSDVKDISLLQGETKESFKTLRELHRLLHSCATDAPSYPPPPDLTPVGPFRPQGDDDASGAPIARARLGQAHRAIMRSTLGTPLVREQSEFASQSGMLHGKPVLPRAAPFATSAGNLRPAAPVSTFSEEGRAKPRTRKAKVQQPAEEKTVGAVRPLVFRQSAAAEGRFTFEMMAEAVAKVRSGVKVAEREDGFQLPPQPAPFMEPPPLTGGIKELDELVNVDEQKMSDLPSAAIVFVRTVARKKIEIALSHEIVSIQAGPDMPELELLAKQP
jgi:hypothetical protein